MEVVSSISTLAAEAAIAEQDSLVDSQDGDMNEVARAAVIQRRQYLRTLHKVIDQSDVIIMVLDARDPEGCRSQTVEDEVRRREADGKRLIFVLNKIGEQYILFLIIVSTQFSFPRSCSTREC
jgi:nuclear GTP-binding protein